MGFKVECEGKVPIIPDTAKINSPTFQTSPPHVQNALEMEFTAIFTAALKAFCIHNCFTSDGTLACAAASERLGVDRVRAGVASITEGIVNTLYDAANLPPKPPTPIQ